MECLKGRDITRGKRSIPERSSLDYIHRVILYRGLVYEWGNGVEGYHYGKEPVISQCDVTWEKEPAGRSVCHKEVGSKYPNFPVYIHQHPYFSGC